MGDPVLPAQYRDREALAVEVRRRFGALVVEARIQNT